jgi:adenine-specific DNA-methyltransferase
MPRRLRLFTVPAPAALMSRDERRATGSFYTPPELVRLVVEWTLGPAMKDQPPRVLDPSCGAGEFTLEVQLQLCARYGQSAMRRCIAAIDVDAQAVQLARQRLIRNDARFPAESVMVGDTLFSDKLVPASFDVVVGNPPYVNIRELAKSKTTEQIAQLRQRYSTARGNFDLYVLFIQRAIELLKPGGRCGLIIPGKWTTLAYAEQCRKLLLERTTIEHVVDLSHARAFHGANVFPHVVIFRKEPADERHQLISRQIESGAIHRVPQRSLNPSAIRLVPSIDVESRVATRPLGELATFACGTAGYSAENIARRLYDASPSSPVAANEADFITSGNIDRYSIRLGNVRYLNRSYSRSRLPLNIPELTLAKRQLFTSPKIVIAGMSRRLEAAWDDRGLALGVQVYAASHCQVDPYYLLAVLNSKLMSFLFATRYAAKRLSGGYLAINKLQLVQLPIAMPSTKELASLTTICRQLHASAQETGAADNALDAQIDRLIYRLYRLTDAEIARVESHFTASQRQAA